MPLGLGSNLSRAISKPITPGIVTDSLVLKHKYNAGSVVPVSDGAAYFDDSSYISLSSTITLSPHDTPCSFVFWARRNNITTWDIALGHSSVNNHKFIIFDDEGGDRMMFEGNTDGDNLTGTTSIRANEWNHFAITADGNAGGKMYQNGAEISVTVNDTFNWDAEFNRIGGGANGNFFNGYICNMGIWNGTALTEPQIKSIMNKNYAGLTDSEKTNLLHWWNLNEDANDSHGSNNGTL